MKHKLGSKRFWKREKNLFKKKLRYINIFLNKNKKKYFFLFFFIIFSFILYVSLQYTILSDDYEIKEIRFLEKNINDYPNKDMFSKIQSGIIGENYYIFKYLKKGNYEKQILDEFNILKSFDINHIGNGVAILNVNYVDFDFIFTNDNSYIASFGENMFSLYSGSSLISENNKIKIPNYIKKSHMDKSFFYKVNSNLLKSQIEDIKNIVGEENIDYIKYIPGASRTIVYQNNGPDLYFNNLVDISLQLKKYRGIVASSLVNYKSLLEIDLGSNNDVIIKNK
ncbi:hypothetical protein VAMP_18n248 [Candidatus Vampirococcus lugosii]|uniref:Cell division protein DivIB n=1 Tax=Candidatus Vampirococcus lugosii TaxID=2789015 RepID=A0ABS5QMJ8_9BACT|nr:hypothetical protein [Candidatus Vampirococcus lugosii]